MVKLGVLLLSLFIVVVAVFLTLRLDDEHDGSVWAVLIAGSSGFDNYAMQADICHAYHVLRNGGVKEENIIVAMADDIANNSKNFKPGMIFNKPSGADVYHGVPKDYTGQNFTLHNIIAMLSGNKKALRGGSGKVLAPNSNDRIFIFYSGHGLPGLLQLGGAVLTREVLYDVIKQIHIKKNYKSLVMYVVSCYSGSMFVKFDKEYKDMRVYIMTSSHDKEPSFQTANHNGIRFGTMFGTEWMKYSEKHDRRNKTLEEQYQYVKRMLRDGGVGQSEAKQYGEKEFSKHTLHLYQGFV